VINKHICSTLAEVVRRGLGGATIVSFPKVRAGTFCCHVRYGGRVFVVSVDDLTAYLDWMVLNMDGTIDEHTGKVLELLDDMTQEYTQHLNDRIEKEWPNINLEKLIQDLRKLADEGDDDEPANPIR
jgi:hypothetical protein